MKTLVLFISFYSFFIYANYTGERILNAAQKYGMTDNEINYLLDNTAPDLTMRDPKFGATALIHACANNRPNMVKILIERGGSNIDEVDNNGETCLMAASKKGHIDVIKILLQFGANQSIVGNLNKTAYDYAVESGNTEVARLLGGPPKQKISFKTIAKSMQGMGVKSGTGQPQNLSSEKYLEDLAKVNSIIDKWKPSSTGPTGNKQGISDSTPQVAPVPINENVAKVEQIGKTLGFSDLVKKQMQNRDLEEERLKKEKEERKAKNMADFRAKIKALAAFNNLYLDIKAKNAQTPTPTPSTPPQPVRDTSKLSFSDATNLLINDMESKLKKKEEEVEKEKETDINKGANERIEVIKKIIFAGSKGNDISALKNEPEEKLKEKVEAIKNVVDVKESKQSRWASVQAARKKVIVISMIQTYDRSYQAKLNALKREEEEMKRKAAMDAKLEADRKKAELDKFEDSERSNFYQVVSNRVKVEKFKEGGRKKSLGEPIALEDSKIQEESALAERKEFDQVIGAMKTPDFTFWNLTSSDCRINRSPLGKYYVLISKLKFSDVAANGRREATWFVNLHEQPSLPNGGMPCGGGCTDMPIYLWRTFNNPKREQFFNNVVIQLGKGKKDHFEIYSSIKGNPTIKIPVTMCKGFDN